MKFIIRNQAGIANKYVRFAKWKIRSFSAKFRELLYSEIYIKKISAQPLVYAATVKMGIPGNDIIVSSKSQDLNSLWSELSAKMKRQLRKSKTKSRVYS